MRTFRDKHGNEWLIEVNVTSAKRVKAANIDLLAADPETLFGRLSTDAELLVNVIYLLCKPEADKRNVTEEQFGEAIVGDAIEHATRALLESILDFFPKARRDVLKRALDKAETVQIKANERAMQMIDRLDVDALLQKTFTESVTN